MNLNLNVLLYEQVNHEVSSDVECGYEGRYIPMEVDVIEKWIQVLKEHSYKVHVN